MQRLRGIIMIISGAMLWGATGPMIEWILETKHLTVPFLLTVRLITAGLSLLIVMLAGKKDIFSVWKTPSGRTQLLLFSVFGMLGLQYTFFATIQASSSVLATLLQFSGPIFITIYVAAAHRKFPPRYQMLGIGGTLAGLFLLLTNGSLDTLAVSPKAILWGLGLGLTYAFYTLYPARLMKELSVLIVVGWSMLVGGILLGLATHVWDSPQWSILAQPSLAVLVITLIILGTLAFVLYLNSMKYISAVETSILGSMEPLTTMIISVLWLGETLQMLQLAGALLMLAFISWMSAGGRKQKNTPRELSL